MQPSHGTDCRRHNAVSNGTVTGLCKRQRMTYENFALSISCRKACRVSFSLWTVAAAGELGPLSRRPVSSVGALLIAWAMERAGIGSSKECVCEGGGGLHALMDSGVTRSQRRLEVRGGPHAMRLGRAITYTRLEFCVVPRHPGPCRVPVPGAPTASG